MKSVGCGGGEDVPNPTAHTRGGRWVAEGSVSTNRQGAPAGPLEPAPVAAPLALGSIIPRKHRQEEKCSFMEARQQNWKLTLYFYVI